MCPTAFILTLQTHTQINTAGEEEILQTEFILQNEFSAFDPSLAAALEVFDPSLAAELETFDPSLAAALEVFDPSIAAELETFDHH